MSALPTTGLALRRASLLLVIVALTGGAHAQDGASEDVDAASGKTKVLLRERDREQLHPGDPLKISGLEQGANDIRSRTPALERSNRSVRLVDPEQAHQRALAMYAEGAVFREPIVRASGGEDSGPGNASSPKPGALGSSGLSSKGHSTWGWGLALFVVAAAAIFVQRRHVTPLAKQARGR